MKIFLAGEVLRRAASSRAPCRLVHDQTAVGLVVKERLRDSEHDQRIKSAADDRENQGGHDRAANFREEFFHNVRRGEEQ